MVDNGKLAGILDPKSQGISPAPKGWISWDHVTTGEDGDSPWLAGGHV